MSNANVPEGGEGLLAAVQRHIGEHAGASITVDSVEPLAGGACQDNYVIRAQFDGDARRFVLRADANSSLLNSIPRRLEREVIAAAVAVGVATPAAQWGAEDLTRAGASSYFMPWVDGVAIGRKVVADPRLHDARCSLPGRLAVELAKIHAISPGSATHLFGGQPPPRSASSRALLDIEQFLERLPVARPALRAVLRWLEDNEPDADDLVLNHGDFRTGNFMVTPAGLSAVLDWEFAHWGSREEDLSWICVRDWRFGVLHKPVGGFGDRAEFLAAYEAQTGLYVDLEKLWWWEVMGNARWAVGAVQQATRYLSGLERDVEHLAIGRRTAEMEWEALRLIRTGPPSWR